MTDSVELLQKELGTCSRCPSPDRGPHRFAGRAGSRVMLVGQAPAKPFGPEGRPFGRGNGHTRLFGWLSCAGWTEEEFRASAYMTSVTKCYPGPSPGGKGDRKPGKAEIEACREFLFRELDLIRPRVLIPVGQLAISMLVGGMKLSDSVGKSFELDFCGWQSTAVPLPHPSGASLWNNLAENRALVEQAVDLLRNLKNKFKL